MTNEKKIAAVGVVEDDPAVRSYFAAVIARTEGLGLAFAAPTLAEARSAIAEAAPDLCLVDLGLPDGNGVDFIRELKARAAAKVLVATVFGDRATVMAALKAGADGYVLKSLTEKELLAHIRQTLAGFTPVSPQVATYLLELLKPSAAAAPAGGEALSAKEVEILTVFGRGLTYAETATALGLTPNTVRDYVRKIYAKLNVHSRSEALFEAASLGVMAPPADNRRT